MLIASNMSLIFSCYIQTQTEYMPEAPTRIQFLGFNLANALKLILILGKDSLNEVNSSFKPNNKSHFYFFIRSSLINTVTKSFVPGIILLLSSLM